MAHMTRIAEMPLRPDVRKAAVLVSLFEKEHAWHTVLIRRKSIPGDVHAGQISFPGGRAQTGESLEEAAIRETHEEIGNLSQHTTIIGGLTSLHIPVSNHLVFPLVSFIDQSQLWIPQESEVDFVLEVPIEEFLKEETRVKASIRSQEGYLLRDVPCYKVQGHLIWGATAMILSEFVAVLVEMSRG